VGRAKQHFSRMTGNQQRTISLPVRLFLYAAVSETTDTVIFPFIGLGISVVVQINGTE